MKLMKEPVSNQVDTERNVKLKCVVYLDDLLGFRESVLFLGKLFLIPALSYLKNK